MIEGGKKEEPIPISEWMLRCLWNYCMGVTALSVLLNTLTLNHSSFQGELDDCP